MAPDSTQLLLTQGEGEGLEFKSSLADTRKVIETIAAMATMGGGVVLVGVGDDGRVVGANVGEGELERLVQQLLASTDPRVYVRITDERLEGKRVVRIEVPPGDGPHLAFGRAFHRVGRATVAMTRDEYERRLLDRLRESSGFERRHLDGATTRALDPAAIAGWVALAKARLSGATQVDDAPARLHLTSGEAVTVAGWLMFSAEPEGLLPQAMVRCRAERGALQDSQAIGGPIYRQIDRSFEFVQRNLRTRTTVEGARRLERPELPLRAVREVITNAVAHRDYRSTAAIQLRLTDDSLEVWSPGTLPAPLTPAALRQRHPSIPPNPLLARALYLAGYIEEWGSGTLNVIDEMRANGHPEPTFESQDNAGIRVVLPMGPATGSLLSARQQAGLKGVKAGQDLRAVDYARRARVSVRTAQDDLRALEALGLLQRVGVGRSFRWRRT